MPLPEAVDAERFDDQGTNKLTIEDTRIAPDVMSALTCEGYSLSPLGEYGVTPRTQLADRSVAACGARLRVAFSAGGVVLRSVVEGCEGVNAASDAARLASSAVVPGWAPRAAGTSRQDR